MENSCECMIFSSFNFEMQGHLIETNGGTSSFFGNLHITCLNAKTLNACFFIVDITNSNLDM